MSQIFLRAIGLMSGTSLDGVDAAWVETDGVRISRTGVAATLHYEPSLRADLRRLLDLAPGIAPDDPFLKDVERRLTEDHAIACAMIGQGADVIGFHGQTILHAPARKRTWQIGDAALLAARTRTSVVHDFRSADVAAGGPGRAAGAAVSCRTGARPAEAAADREHRRGGEHHLPRGRRRDYRLRHRPRQRPAG